MVDDQVFDPARWGLLYFFLKPKTIEPPVVRTIYHCFRVSFMVTWDIASVEGMVI